MPRFNARGAAVQGVGNGPASVDGRVIHPAGGGPSAWLDDETILTQALGGLTATNIHTGASTGLGPGMNELSAGGCGSYLAWTDGVGLHGALTLPAGGLNRVMTDGRGANSADGCLVYLAERQANGPTRVRHPSGDEAHLPDVYGLHVLRWGVAVWNAGPGGLGFWGPACAFLPGAAYAKLAELHGERWLVYTLDGVGLIAHRGQAPDVYHLVTAGDAFHMDVAVVDGRLAVCWSTTSGEGPDQLVKVLDVLACPTRPYDVPSPPAPIPVEEITPLVGHWIMGWYELRNTPESQGVPLPPGNMEVAVRGYPPGLVRPRPIIATHEVPPDTIAPVYLMRVGSEAADQNDDPATMLQKMEQQAWDLYEIGIQTCFYWDMRDVPYWPALPPDVVWEQVAYCGRDEPLDQFEAWLDGRCADVCARYPYVVIAAQTHTTNTSLLADPSRAIPPVQRILDRYRGQHGARMAGLIVFNDAGRDDPATGEGGLTANPQLRPHWERLFSGITGLPDVFSHAPENGGPPVSELVVQITGYDSTVSRRHPNGLHVTYDMESDAPIVATTVWMEDGSAPLEQTYPVKAGSDGRYVRGMNFKPTLTGTYHFNVRVRDAQGREATTRSAGPVTVTEEPVDEPPGAVPGCVNGLLGHPAEYIFAHLSALAGHAIRIGDPSGGPSVWRPLLARTGFLPNPDANGKPIPADAPHYGICMGVSGGEPTSRLWLPTTTAYIAEDGKHWFLRRLDLIEHETQAWKWGEWHTDPPYVPRAC